MSDFVPSLDEVRAIYAMGTPAHHVTVAGSYAEFDRAIAKVRAEAKVEAWDEGWDAGFIELRIRRRRTSPARRLAAPPTQRRQLGEAMSANDKLAATFHPHPSYTAMEAAWDPARREAARLALARQIDQHAPRVGRGTRKDTP